MARLGQNLNVRGDTVADVIIVAGSLAQRPGQGGHTWVFLQYLLGLRRLDWNVLFLDRLEPGMCVDTTGAPCSFEDSWNLSYFLDVLKRFGLADSFSLVYNQGERVVGLPRQQVLERVATAPFLLNVMGFCDDEEILGQARRRVFLDIDPGFPQMWRELGLHDPFLGHDAFVTVGENIGHSDCTVPTCGLSWITTPQPIVLEHWPVVPNRGGCFTSVATWRGDFGPVEYQGTTYGLRVHEFRRFISLPHLTGSPFLLALDIHSAEENDIDLLAANGWSRKDPREVVGDPWSYQAFIGGSKAEFGIAKQMYVRSIGGWFSDRSICYLASGKPVLAQDTGFSRYHQTGDGLLRFATLDEAVAGVDAIEHNYTRHACAARAIAEDDFDSDKVLTRLLGKLGVA
jgi:hypothetical protein